MTNTHSPFYDGGDDEEPTTEELQIIEAGYELDDDIGGKIDKDDSDEQAL